MEKDKVVVNKDGMALVKPEELVVLKTKARLYEELENECMAFWIDENGDPLEDEGDLSEVGYFIGEYFGMM